MSAVVINSGLKKDFSSERLGEGVILNTKHFLLLVRTDCRLQLFDSSAVFRKWFPVAGSLNSITRLRHFLKANISVTIGK